MPITYKNIPANQRQAFSVSSKRLEPGVYEINHRHLVLKTELLASFGY